LEGGSGRRSERGELRSLNLEETRRVGIEKQTNSDTKVKNKSDFWLIDTWKSSTSSCSVQSREMLNVDLLERKEKVVDSTLKQTVPVPLRQSSDSANSLELAF